MIRTGPTPSAPLDGLPPGERHLLEPGREAERRARALDPDAPPEVLAGLACYEPVAVLANPALPLLELAGAWRWETLPVAAYRALSSEPAFPERAALPMLEAGRRQWAKGRGHLSALPWEPARAIANPGLPRRLREELLAAWWESFSPLDRHELAHQLGSPLGTLLERAHVRPGTLSPDELETLCALGGFAHEALADQPGCPVALLDSPSAFVRSKLAKRPELAGEVAARYAASRDVALAHGLARNPAAPLEVLAGLVEVAVVRWALAGHPRLPAEALARLAAHATPGDYLARQLLAREDLPPELRAALSRT